MRWIRPIICIVTPFDPAGDAPVAADADGLGFDADPLAAALPAITGAWQQAARAAGWDPLYGRHLVADLRRCGLRQVAGRAHRSYEPGGEAWAGAQLGIERLRDQIHAAGASQADIDGALAALARPHPDHHRRADRHCLGPARRIASVLSSRAASDAPARRRNAAPSPVAATVFGTHKSRLKLRGPG